MSESDHIPSKTEIKKQMLELQELGEKVIALPENLFIKIPLDEQLKEAMITARKITKHGGLKRQLQYVGKLMRHRDVDDIRAAINEIELGNQKETDLFHEKERWREHLLQGESQYLTEFYNLYPKTDIQQLRQLIRNYKSAKNEAKKKQSSRIIFKLIAEQIDPS